MTATQVNEDTCGALGNVVQWNTLQEQGSAVISVRQFPDCEGSLQKSSRSASVNYYKLFILYYFGCFHGHAFRHFA